MADQPLPLPVQHIRIDAVFTRNEGVRVTISTGNGVDVVAREAGNFGPGWSEDHIVREVAAWLETALWFARESRSN